MIKKGEVLQVARVAGITAARTFEWIPLCHLVALTKCEIQFDWRNQTCLEVRCFTKTVGSTGVEMEALTGVQAALLTIYDMCKAIDRGMTMTNIGLLEKMVDVVVISFVLQLNQRKVMSEQHERCI